MKFAPVLFYCWLAIAAAPPGYGQGAALPAGTKYVMSHFKADGGGGDERLFISVSPDGLNWTALNNGSPVWQPANWSAFNNVVRDPSIIFDNGFWWVAYTSGTYGHHASFGLVRSADLLHWTFVGEIDATIPGAAAQYGTGYDPLTWNPVFFRDGDGSVHLFVNINPVNGSQYNPTPSMHPYELHPSNNDWTQWSAPALVGLPETDTNEFFAWKTGAVYNAIFVDFNDGGAWEYATSNSLLDGWQYVRSIHFNGQEGGMVIPQPGGANRLFLEPGNGSQSPGYRECDSADQFATFTAQQTVTASVAMRNGKMTSDFPQSQLVPGLRGAWRVLLAVLLVAAAFVSLRTKTGKPRRLSA